MNKDQRYIIKHSIPVTECGCWIWLGYVLPSGYGTFKRGNTHHRAHRASYEAFVGDIPDDLVVMHQCDMPACVNPQHLSIGTHLDNVKDRVRKRRGNIKLNEMNVRHILQSKSGCRTLAREYGVHKSLIQDIRQGKAWHYVKIG